RTRPRAMPGAVCVARSCSPLPATGRGAGGVRSARHIISSMPEPITIHTAEHYLWGQVCDGWHLVRAPELSVIQERVPTGAAEARPYPTRSREFCFVLEGQAVLEADGERYLLGPRPGLEVPPSTPHQLSNDSAHDVVFLVISQPPSHADRLPAGPVSSK